MIDLAIKIAQAAHKGQVDKAGEPYILHPLRVMLQMPTNELQVVAALHDVVEDGGVTLEYIENYFGSDIAFLLERLTRKEGESYLAYISRINMVRKARLVKVADITDNIKTERLAKLDELTQKRLCKKYFKALEILNYGQD